MNTGRHGTSWNFYEAGSANASARANCGVFDCQIIFWVQNSCGALAVGDNNLYGWAINPSMVAAENIALIQCSQRTYNCQVQAWVCSNSGGY